MHHGIVLFTSDRGITPAAAARAAEAAGFGTFYVPEHTHIPVRRDAAHPGTGDASLPDDRYSRTLDPWVSLATAAAVTSTIRLATAVNHVPAARRRTVLREYVEAMRALWIQDEASYDGEFVSFGRPGPTRSPCRPTCRW